MRPMQPVRPMRPDLYTEGTYIITYPPSLSATAVTGATAEVCVGFIVLCSYEPL